MGANWKSHAAAGDSELDEWLKAARAGCNGSFGKLLLACQESLLIVAKHELGQGLRAKIGDLDVVQDTFAEAKRDFDKFRGNSGSQFRMWLLRILRNNLANAKRDFHVTQKRRVTREVPLDVVIRNQDLGKAAMDDAPTPYESIRRREVDHALEMALQRLPSDYRTAVILRHREYLSFEKIGKRIGRSSEATRKLWARAIGVLRQELLQLNPYS
jgi:RNA polymerase sigma-70 factor (ECF subfamily)